MEMRCSGGVQMLQILGLVLVLGIPNCEAVLRHKFVVSARDLAPKFVCLNYFDSYFMANPKRGHLNVG